jgi:hypothetical protein
MTDPRSSAGKHPPEYPRSLPAPPRPLNLFERPSDLKGGKIRQPNWAYCEQRDHEAVAHASGASEIIVGEPLPLRCKKPKNAPYRLA